MVLHLFRGLRLIVIVQKIEKPALAEPARVSQVYISEMLWERRLA
jgi:hypothetical protein